MKNYTKFELSDELENSKPPTKPAALPKRKFYRQKTKGPFFGTCQRCDGWSWFREYCKQCRLIANLQKLGVKFRLEEKDKGIQNDPQC